jgi:hypothetical protein
MQLNHYLRALNTDILDLNIFKLYKKASRDLIIRRLINQLKFFDRLALDSAKIADVGSGLGIHANFFHLKGAQVKLFEPDEELYNSCKLLFPHLNISNNEFNVDDIFDIITLFGVYQFVSKEYIDNIYQHTKILIVDSATPVELDYKCKFTEVYYDPITNYDSGRKRHFKVFVNDI